MALEKAIKKRYGPTVLKRVIKSLLQSILKQRINYCDVQDYPSYKIA